MCIYIIIGAIELFCIFCHVWFCDWNFISTFTVYNYVQVLRNILNYLKEVETKLQMADTQGSHCPWCSLIYAQCHRLYQYSYIV